MASKYQIAECYDCLACLCFQHEFSHGFMAWVIDRGWTVRQMATMDKEELFREIGDILSVDQRRDFRFICEQLIELHQGKDCAVVHPNYFGKWDYLKVGDALYDANTAEGGMTRGDIALLLESPVNGLVGRDHYAVNLMDGVYQDQDRFMKYSYLPLVERDRVLIIETRTEGSLASRVELNENYVSQVGARASLVTLGLSADRMDDLGGLLAGGHFSVVVLDCLCTLDPSNEDQEISIETVQQWVDFLTEKMVDFEQSLFVVLIPLPATDPTGFAQQRGFMKPEKKFYSRLKLKNKKVISLLCTDHVDG